MLVNLLEYVYKFFSRKRKGLFAFHFIEKIEDVHKPPRRYYMGLLQPKKKAYGYV
jgi:hypothetical protein